MAYQPGVVPRKLATATVPVSGCATILAAGIENGMGRSKFDCCDGPTGIECWALSVDAAELETHMNKSIGSERPLSVVTR